MTRMIKGSLLLGLLLLPMAIAFAQHDHHSPPKVLIVIREFLKPGKAGAPHERTESGFVRAFQAAKWPQHYLAADSISGPARSVFFVGYDSFAAWEKDTADTAKNGTLSAALGRATAADGEMLANYESSTFVYREDLSFQADIDVSHARYFEITQFRIKPGHERDWEEIVKIYKDKYGKAVPDAHWAVFEDMYGNASGGLFAVFTPMKSLAEVDESFGNSKKFAAAMGEDGVKKLSELISATVESTQSNLLQFNPRISYPPDEWVKGDPFWKPATAPSAKAANPAQ